MLGNGQAEVWRAGCPGTTDRHSPENMAGASRQVREWEWGPFGRLGSQKPA